MAHSAHAVLMTAQLTLDGRCTVGLLRCSTAVRCGVVTAKSYRTYVLFQLNEESLFFIDPKLVAVKRSCRIKQVLHPLHALTDPSRTGLEYVFLIAAELTSFA
jgi:hypothetical protein